MEWQGEIFFAVSVSDPIAIGSQIETVRNYIKKQEEHHKHKTFQQEYDEFLLNMDLKNSLINLAKANNK